MAASTLFFWKKMQLLSVGHGLSTQLLVVDVEESVHELNAPHFPISNSLSFLRIGKSVMHFQNVGPNPSSNGELRRAASVSDRRGSKEPVI